MALGVNALLVLLILGVAYALASEGLWGAALMFFNVLFAGLIAFNFYEPLAALLVQNAAPVSGYADTLCLLGIFLVSLVLLRIITESIAPAMVRFPTPVYHLGRWFFGFAAGCVLMAILLLSFYTSPVHKKVFGVITYDFKPPFNMGLDRYWLAFVQYTTGYVFANYNNDVIDPEFKEARVFDPRGEWLIVHQNARPYGEDFVPAREGAATDGAGGAVPAPGAGGGAGTHRNRAGPTMGGTAGAAAGIANPN
jgi:hypothetical protein